jgi:molybdopterin molybdotransferase
MTSRSLAEHRAVISAGVQQMPALDVLLGDAAGGMLAQDLVPDAPVPPVAVAACDGYAVLAQDVAGASIPYPCVLAVSHDVSFDARARRRHVVGTAARVSTGVPLPTGADAVVPVAHTDGGVARVGVTGPVKPGEHVRAAGFDAVAGEPLVRQGTRLSARHIAAAAAIGRSRLTVRPVPRVVIIAVGSELVEPGAHRPSGGVPEASAHLLTVAVREAGAQPYRVGAVPDARVALRGHLADQLVRADVIITTGGLSGAPHDTLAEVIREVGEFSVVDLALAPGVHHGYGTLEVSDSGRSIPVFGLPGHPVAAAVAFETYVRPALRAMSGLTEHDRSTVAATASNDWTSPAGIAHLVAVRIQGNSAAGYTALALGDPGNLSLATLANADGYVLMGPLDTDVRRGDTVSATMWGA